MRSETQVQNQKSPVDVSCEHEVRGLFQIPGTLRFVENHDVFYRRANIDQRVVTKMMNVLDKGFNAFTNFAFAHLSRLVASDVRLRRA